MNDYFLKLATGTNEPGVSTQDAGTLTGEVLGNASGSGTAAAVSGSGSTQSKSPDLTDFAASGETEDNSVNELEATTGNIRLA